MFSKNKLDVEEYSEFSCNLRSLLALALLANIKTALLATEFLHTR